MKVDSQAPLRAVQCLLACRLIVAALQANYVDGPPEGREHPPKRQFANFAGESNPVYLASSKIANRQQHDEENITAKKCQKGT